MGFPAEQMNFEVKAISLPEVQRFPKVGRDSIKRSIYTPHALLYDSEKHVLQMSLGGSRTLKEVYTDSTIDIREWGEMIGTLLVNFHQQTRFTDIGKNSSGRFVYNNLETSLQEYGHNKGLGERINAKYGSLLATDDECICHSDHWSGKPSRLGG